MVTHFWYFFWEFPLFPVPLAFRGTFPHPFPAGGPLGTPSLLGGVVVTGSMRQRKGSHCCSCCVSQCHGIHSYLSPPNPFPLGLLILLTTSALLLLLPLLLIPLMILFDFNPHTVSPLPSLPCRFLWKWFQVQVLNGTYHVSFLVGFPDSSRVDDYRASAFVTSCIVEKGCPPGLCRLLCIFSLGE